ncbi:potassium transporter Kup [Serratia sp. S1B]|nr:potassium transporter Kup [Serratia sp. S1B]
MSIVHDQKSSKQASLTMMAGGALGVVFGDIGTSPLYTFKTVLLLSGEGPSPAVILGLLSLIFWTLVMVTSVKYALFAMRIDNNGEGGILALMSLLVSKKGSRPAVIFAGLFGAALIYGDGAITPAISVLSALEGLNIILPASQPYILPATVIILVSLFIIQPLGTARIGKVFGPIMALWFAVIAVLGVWGIALHPAVLVAVNPVYGIEFLFSNGIVSFLVLGGVFLCVTGAEALYADMGHFGKRPIWISWFGIVFPSLLLNYAGQAALILSGADVTQNIFFRLCPSFLQVPLVILATLATIIASQAIISGAFSMTRQAIQLGWLPRLRVKQTTEESYGQIYIGTINWLLMAVTVFLAVFFKSSDNLAAAYGIAVSLTMTMTTGLLFVAMREVWKWSLTVSLIVAGGFFIIDLSFLIANLTKVLQGGYLPLLLAAAVYIVMLIWHRGAVATAQAVNEKVVPIADFMASIEEKAIPRVPGTAIFMTRSQDGIPPVMKWHVKRNGSLHTELLALNVVVLNVPRVADEDRLTMTELTPDFWRGVAYYGFMERPNIPQLLRHIEAQQCGFNLTDVTYYLGHESIVEHEGNNAMPAWQRHAFALMVRNCMHVTDYYYLPSDQVVEISRRVPV